MKVLLLGVGLQGKAALHDLVAGNEATEIIAGDLDVGGLLDYCRTKGYGRKVRCIQVDASSEASIDQVMALRPDIVIDLLPVPCHGLVTRRAIEHGIHLVNTSYVTAEITALNHEAEARGVIILPELGMDPGIDLVLLGDAVRYLDSVDEIISYGAGFPEPQAATNVLKYKVTWRFEGVLQAYRRPARIIEHGAIREIGPEELFHPENLHRLTIEGLGELEAYANGDAVAYAGMLGLEPATLQSMGRYVLRWPGHGALWKTIGELHLLDDQPVKLDGLVIDRKRYLAAVLEPMLRYEQGERDVVIVRIEARGRRDGRQQRLCYQLVDRRDLATGLTAMSRTVGFSASIGAHLINRGVISKPGLRSPLNDVPYEPFVAELRKRGIEVAFSRQLMA